MLYIFGGLPGTGKTELSKYLAETIRATYLRIDTIEQTMRDRGINDIEDEGYQIAFKISADNLKLGHAVVADSTNPIDISRKAWRMVALSQRVGFCEIEIVCSDLAEHKKRVETRQSDIDSLKLPSWNDVVNCEYHPWMTERIIIDTAGRTRAESKNDLRVAVEKWSGGSHELM